MYKVKKTDHVFEDFCTFWREVVTDGGVGEALGVLNALHEILRDDDVIDFYPSPFQNTHCTSIALLCVSNYSELVHVHATVHFACMHEAVRFVCVCACSPPDMPDPGPAGKAGAAAPEPPGA